MIYTWLPSSSLPPFLLSFSPFSFMLEMGVFSQDPKAIRRVSHHPCKVSREFGRSMRCATLPEGSQKNIGQADCRACTVGFAIALLASAVAPIHRVAACPSSLPESWALICAQTSLLFFWATKHRLVFAFCLYWPCKEAWPQGNGHFGVRLCVQLCASAGQILPSIKLGICVSEQQSTQRR